MDTTKIKKTVEVDVRVQIQDLENPVSYSIVVGLGLKNEEFLVDKLKQYLTQRHCFSAFLIFSDQKLLKIVSSEIPTPKKKLEEKNLEELDIVPVTSDTEPEEVITEIEEKDTVNVPATKKPLQEIPPKFKIGEDFIEIQADSKIGETPFLLKGRLDIILVRPDEVEYVQAYSKPVFSWTSTPGGSFSVSREVYLLGLGLLGPFPNCTGVSGFSFDMVVHNTRSGEKVRLKARVEGGPDKIHKFFFGSPLSVLKGDNINVVTQEGNGAVY